MPTGLQSSPDRRFDLAETSFGVGLLALGALVLLAVSNPLEVAVYAGGPVIAMNGMAIFALALWRKSGRARIALGLVTAFLGALLAVHDFLFPPGFAALVHLAIGLAIIAVAVLQLTGRRRYYGRWLKPTPRTAS